MRPSSKIRPHATYANVTATLALFVALGGGSFAVATLSGSEKTVVKKIAKKQADKRITARAPGLSVARAGSAVSATSAENATSADSATNASHANTADTATSATSANHANTADTATSASPSGPAAGVLAGAYPNPELAANAVDTSQIADDAVTGLKISPRTITTKHFQLADAAPLDFPTISAGTCSALTYDGPGSVRSSDHLLITPPSNFADTFTLTAKVDTGLDAVTFVACNVFGGGGSADPDGASGSSYKFLVISPG
jgi:hypothetical protein